MKPDGDTNDVEANNSGTIAGDVIGDTAYSERFVLKILIKLANLDSLKDEIQENSFEDNLCTLWDMTAERDVVLFLQKHDALNLFKFALPDITSPRIIEIIVGIIGNMCCQSVVVNTLLKMEEFLTFLLEYIKSEDSLILIQLLRFVNSALFLVNKDDIIVWMKLFIKIEYINALYFILKNSSSKELLVTALENFNTLCSYCNIDKSRTDFFKYFVTKEAIQSLTVALNEITVTLKDSCEKEELERVLVISLQIVLNLVGFDKSSEIYKDCKENIVIVINIIVSYYENKFINQMEIDSDLVDIIESTYTVVKVTEVSDTCNIDKFFVQSYNMWKALYLFKKLDKNDTNFEEEDKIELQELSKQIRTPLSMLISIYIANCSDSNLLRVLDDIGSHYGDIVAFIKDEELKKVVSKRTENYRTRISDNVDS